MKKCLTCWVLWLLTTTVLAEPMKASDQSSTEQPETQSFWNESAQWLEENRDFFARSVTEIGTGLDQFFSGSTAFEDNNKTYARLRLNLAYRETKGFEFQPEFKFRLSLPATQKNLKLVIENDVDDDPSLERQNRPGSYSEEYDDKTRIQAALEFFDEVIAEWDSRFDIGLRAKAPLNPFLRHRATRLWQLSDIWSSRVRHQLAYYKRDGFRFNEAVYFERLSRNDAFFRTHTEFQWREGYDHMQLIQVLTYYRKLDRERGLEYQLGVVAESMHHTVVSDVYWALAYRQLLYKNWLYFDVIPQLSYPRAEDYESRASLTFRLEVLFFK